MCSITLRQIFYCGGVLSGISGPSCLGGVPFTSGGSMWFVERSFFADEFHHLLIDQQPMVHSRTVNGRGSFGIVVVTSICSVPNVGRRKRSVIFSASV